MLEPLKFKKLDDRAVIPTRANPYDAGLDLSCIDTFKMPNQSKVIVRTGLAIEIPYGWAGFIQPRSGLAAKSGITVLNSPGLIDAGYRGELKVILYNTGITKQFHEGDKIAQLVLMTVGLFYPVEADELSDTVRGSDGFGSTDNKEN